MIDIYFRPTANGHKITIFCEEAGLDYKLIPMESLAGAQFDPKFLRISPNNKMPAIVDHAPADGGPPLSVFESGAILFYLAEKTGKFLSQELRRRTETMAWLMWQMAGLGPMSGQNGHFRHQALAENSTYSKERYFREVGRLYTVLDYRLRGRDYIVDEYSIADMACHPWISTAEIQGLKLDDYPDLERWWTRISERPAVMRAYDPRSYAPSARAATDEEHRRHFRQTGDMLREAYARMEAEAPL
jgi:GST-like protein